MMSVTLSAYVSAAHEHLLDSRANPQPGAGRPSTWQRQSGEVSPAASAAQARAPRGRYNFARCTVERQLYGVVINLKCAPI